MALVRQSVEVKQVQGCSCALRMSEFCLFQVETLTFHLSVYNSPFHPAAKSSHHVFSRSGQFSKFGLCRSLTTEHKAEGMGWVSLEQ